MDFEYDFYRTILKEARGNLPQVKNFDDQAILFTNFMICVEMR
jgi:hypothetical protein